MAVFTGTNSDDTIDGSNSNDTINGQSGNDILNGLNGDDIIIGGLGADVMNGGSGIDTLDYSSSTSSVSVNLVTGRGSGGDATGDRLSNFEIVVGSVYADNLTASVAGQTLVGGLGNDRYVVGDQGVKIVEQANEGIDEVRTSLSTYSLSIYANIEKLTYTGTVNFIGIGNSSDNVISGGDGDDLFQGGGGADRFIGGAGIDIVSYSDSNTSITFDLDSNISTGIAAGDTFTDIEKFIGSSYDDVVFESADVHDFEGGSGIDTISYRNSTSRVIIDLVSGRQTGWSTGDNLSSFEIIEGSNSADILTGNDDSNIFIGGLGSDRINGGSGSDTSSYMGSFAAVRIDLLNSTISGGHATGDVLTNIENLVGSEFADNLSGDLLNNILEGGAGGDIIDGGAGSDTVAYLSSNAGIRVNLLNNTLSGGDAEGDILSDIENIIGSKNSDTITGDAGDNILEGGAGNDIISGGDGADKIYGDRVGVGIYGDYIEAGNTTVKNIDIINGGNGNDFIFTSQDDLGSIANGQGGADHIIVGDGVANGGDAADLIMVKNRGTGYGDQGDDDLRGFGGGYATLFGGDGFDRLQFGGRGFADGGAGGDKYIINTTSVVNIKDTGSDSNADVINLLFVTLRQDLVYIREGNNLRLTSTVDMIDGTANWGVILEDWYTPGGDTIEYIIVNNESIII